MRAVALIVAASLLPGCVSHREKEDDLLITVCALFCVTLKRESDTKMTTEKLPQKAAGVKCNG